MASSIPVKTYMDVEVRKDELKRPFQAQHTRWRELESFRRMDHAAVEDAVWKGVSKQNRKWTILKSDVAAIDHTTTAFLLGDGITVVAEPKDHTSARLSDAANIVERLGSGVWDWLEKDRALSLQQEIILSAVSRGHECIQYGWLSPDERGEAREPVEPQERFEIPGFDAINQPRQRITTQGRSPVFVQVLDPLDCYWQLGKHDRVLEVVHEFRARYSQLVELYPDLADNPRFDYCRTPGAYDTTLTVVDYWNEQVNAINIEGHQYKAPTPHGYGVCPFIIEMIAPQLTRDPNNDGIAGYWGTPFSLPILEHVKALSWADSISATYMEEIAFALLQHKGIRTTGPRSPHIGINPETKEAEYMAVFDFSPDGRVKPMYDNETLEYLQPPRLVDMLQEFKAARMRDIQLLTYAEGILTGVYHLDISGHSVAQQKQAAMARLTPYITGVNRAASRLMTAIFKLFPQEWDRVGPFLIELLVDGIAQEVPVTKELFESVKKVTVNLKPKVPINPEAEMQFMLNAMQMGVFSLRHVMEKAGVQDPLEEMKQIAFETLTRSDPDFVKRLAIERFKELGYAEPQQPQQAQQAQQAAAMPAGPPPQAAPAAMPPGAPPGVAVGGPAAPGGGAGGLPPPYDQILAQLPPELAQQVVAAYASDPQGTLAMLDQLMAQAQGGGAMPLGPGGGDPAMMAGGPAGMMV